MELQAFQPGELRNSKDEIIRSGAYGKKTAFATADNKGILDYIMNNFDALYDMINAHKTYVASEADLPATGDMGTIYVASDTGVWYGWDAEKKAYVAYSDPRTAADEAKASETAAKASETAAANSQKAAAASETNASASATSAKSWAVATDSPDGATDTDASTGKTQSARSWALAAQASAASASAHLDEINRPVYYLDSDGCLCEKIFVEVTE